MLVCGAVPYERLTSTVFPLPCIYHQAPDDNHLVDMGLVPGKFKWLCDRFLESSQSSAPIDQLSSRIIAPAFRRYLAVIIRHLYDIQVPT